MSTGISLCFYQTPVGYFDIDVSTGRGQASHLIPSTAHRCSNQVGEEKAERESVAELWR